MHDHSNKTIKLGSRIQIDGNKLAETLFLGEKTQYCTDIISDVYLV